MVLRTNELVFDLSANEYDSVHGHIARSELERWRSLGTQFLAHNSPITMLDIGTGTGFVPLVFGEFLTSDDTIILADISTRMLDIARAKVESARLPPRSEFVKLAGNELPLPAASIDIITVNAVLHHLAAPTEFSMRLADVLKPGGLLFVGYEPNRRYFTHHVLPTVERWLSRLHRAPALAWRILSGTRHRQTADRPQKYSREVRDLYRRVNHHLMAEGLIDEPMADWMIDLATDYQSPTAGREQLEKGFDPDDFGVALFAGLAVLQIQTHAYCGRQSDSTLGRACTVLLERKFPDCGSKLTAVLSK